jgi:hypothetical protein
MLQVISLGGIDDERVVFAHVTGEKLGTTAGAVGSGQLHSWCEGRNGNASAGGLGSDKAVPIKASRWTAEGFDITMRQKDVRLAWEDALSRESILDMLPDVVCSANVSFSVVRSDGRQSDPISLSVPIYWLDKVRAGYRRPTSR